LPNKNDFGDMGPEDYAKYRQSLKKTNGWNDIVEISKESLKLKIVTPKCVEGII
jgi:hypothetical protein